MLDYQIRAVETGQMLLTTRDVTFAYVLDRAKAVAHELDIEVAIYAQPIGDNEDCCNFTQELWRGKPE